MLQREEEMAVPGLPGLNCVNNPGLGKDEKSPSRGSSSLWEKKKNNQKIKQRELFAVITVR